MTGLSEEEDAARFIVRSFNPDLMFCTNCEVYQLARASFDCNCDRCGMPLAEKDTSPLPTKRKHT